MLGVLGDGMASVVWTEVEAIDEMRRRERADLVAVVANERKDMCLLRFLWPPKTCCVILSCTKE